MILRDFIFGMATFLATAIVSFAQPLDHYLNALYRSHIIPGFSVVVVKDDRIVFQRGYGIEYVGSGQAMTASSSSAIGSLVKSFTSLAILQLVDQGKIRLEDKVVEHIPWFRTANKELSDRITVRMLLNNTAGLRAPLIGTRGFSDKAAEQLVRSLGSVYLTKEPGTSYEYSNVGFAVAGLIIQEVSGISYAEYLKRYILTPLEMNKSSNDPKEFEKINALYGHFHGVDKALPTFSEGQILGEYLAAGSLMRSSASDIGNYLITLLNGGLFKGKQIVSPEMVKEMWIPYSSFPGISKEDGGDDLPFQYGLGWIIGEMNGKEYIFHGGNRRNMSSMTFLLPDQNIGAAILANIDLTFIDRYRYHNLIHIMNNVIRISLDEQLSNFAVPNIDDPTLNNFTLPTEVESKYKGEYFLSEGNDWIYQGSKLNILSSEDQLRGEITKGNEHIEHFNIDFITQKTAVSRNLSVPRTIHFKFYQNGEVSDVILGGLKYSGLPDSYRERFQMTNSSDKAVQFDFPADWNVSWAGLNFTGSPSTNQEEQIIGMLSDTEVEAEILMKELFPEHELIRKGREFFEIHGSHSWKEQAITSNYSGQSFNHYVMITQQADKSYSIVMTTQNDLSGSLRSIIPAMLRTFRWID